MKSPVLQTLPICEQHISTCLAEKLKEGVSEWKLERPGRSIALKSNKCCKCSQWSWSTCAQQSARCPDSWQQSERLWSFFHCNTTAAYILETSRWCWMYQIDGDISAVREIKDAVRKNLQNRCSDPKFLRLSQEMFDQRFRTLSRMVSARPWENLRPPQRLCPAGDITKICLLSRQCGQTAFFWEENISEKRGVKLDKAVLVDFD